MRDNWKTKINLEVQRPSKKAPRTGDVFCVKVKNGSYLYGLVANGEIHVVSWPAVLAYIFKKQTSEKEVPDLGAMSRKDHLIPPIILDPSCWSTGIVETVGRIGPDDIKRVPQHCFWDVVDEEFVDEHGTPLPKQVVPTGTYGVAPPRGLDNEISKALGIPLAPD